MGDTKTDLTLPDGLYKNQFLIFKIIVSIALKIFGIIINVFWRNFLDNIAKICSMPGNLIFLEFRVLSIISFKEKKFLPLLGLNIEISGKPRSKQLLIWFGSKALKEKGGPFLYWFLAQILLLDWRMRGILKRDFHFHTKLSNLHSFIKSIVNWGYFDKHV